MPGAGSRPVYQVEINLYTCECGFGGTNEEEEEGGERNKSERGTRERYICQNGSPIDESIRRSGYANWRRLSGSTFRMFWLLSFQIFIM